MKRLEEILSNTPKPDVKVKGFQKDLRQSLLDSHRFRSSSGVNYRLAFYFSTAVATVCAGFLILLVSQPTLSWKAHYALVSDSGSLQGNKLGYKVDYRDIPSYGAAKDVAGSYQRLLAKDVDQEFVRYLAENHYYKDLTNIEPVALNQLFSISRYKLDNGKDVFVYTRIPADQVKFQESY